MERTIIYNKDGTKSMNIMKKPEADTLPDTARKPASNASDTSSQAADRRAKPSSKPPPCQGARSPVKASPIVDSSVLGKKKKKKHRKGKTPGNDSGSAAGASVDEMHCRTGDERDSHDTAMYRSQRAHRHHCDNMQPSRDLWSNDSQEERQRIREFWLQLGEEERRALVKVEKEAVLHKLKEQQKRNCSCSFCGRKRTAIEEELEILYDAYYEELEQYANQQQHQQQLQTPQPPLRQSSPSSSAHPIDKNTKQRMLIELLDGVETDDDLPPTQPCSPSFCASYARDVDGTYRLPEAVLDPKLSGIDIQLFERYTESDGEGSLYNSVHAEVGDEDDREVDAVADDEDDDGDDEDDEVHVSKGRHASSAYSNSRCMTGDSEADSQRQRQQHVPRSEKGTADAARRHGCQYERPDESARNNHATANGHCDHHHHHHHHHHHLSQHQHHLDHEHAHEHDHGDHDLDSYEYARSADLRSSYFNFGSSLTVKGGILTVADDLLKNDGKKFLDMMERLAERRLRREDDVAYDQDEYLDDDEYDDEEYDDEELDDDPLTEEQRMEEGRRMFQMFAARLFEQRVLTAYREKVARERQELLLREIEDEERVKQEKEMKKQREKERKKDRKRQQKQQRDEERLQREVKEREEEERRLETERQRKEDAQKRREEERLKREEEKRQREEERRRKEEEKRRKEKQREQEQREREQEERTRKEQADKERLKREQELKEQRKQRKTKEPATTLPKERAPTRTAPALRSVDAKRPPAESVVSSATKPSAAVKSPVKKPVKAQPENDNAASPPRTAVAPVRGVISPGRKSDGTQPAWSNAGTTTTRERSATTIAATTTIAAVVPLAVPPHGTGAFTAEPTLSESAPATTIAAVTEPAGHPGHPGHPAFPMAFPGSTPLSSNANATAGALASPLLPGAFQNTPMSPLIAQMATTSVGHALASGERPAAPENLFSVASLNLGMSILPGNRVHLPYGAMEQRVPSPAPDVRKVGVIGSGVTRAPASTESITSAPGAARQQRMYAPAAPGGQRSSSEDSGTRSTAFSPVVGGSAAVSPTPAPSQQFQTAARTDIGSSTATVPAGHSLFATSLFTTGNRDAERVNDGRTRGRRHSFSNEARSPPPTDTPNMSAPMSTTLTPPIGPSALNAGWPAAPGAGAVAANANPHWPSTDNGLGGAIASGVGQMGQFSMHSDVRLSIRERAIAAYFKLEAANAYQTGMRMEYVPFAALYAAYLEMFPGYMCEQRDLYASCTLPVAYDRSLGINDISRGQFAFRQHPNQPALLLTRFEPDTITPGQAVLNRGFAGTAATATAARYGPSDPTCIPTGGAASALNTAAAVTASVNGGINSAVAVDGWPSYLTSPRNTNIAGIWQSMGAGSASNPTPGIANGVCSVAGHYMGSSSTSTSG